MKALIALLVTFCSMNALAIVFITPEEVAAAIGADSAEEVNKYDYAEKYISPDSDCFGAILSKSGRAYIITQDGAQYLYVTASNLDGLMNCGPL